jgi:hypothetical protein
MRMDITKSHIVPLIADEEKIGYFINRRWDLSPEYWFESYSEHWETGQPKVSRRSQDRESPTIENHRLLQIKKTCAALEYAPAV